MVKDGQITAGGQGCSEEVGLLRVQEVGGRGISQGLPLCSMGRRHSSTETQKNREGVGKMAQ